MEEQELSISIKNAKRKLKFLQEQRDEVFQEIRQLKKLRKQFRQVLQKDLENYAALQEKLKEIARLSLDNFEQWQ